MCEWLKKFNQDIWNVIVTCGYWNTNTLTTQCMFVIALCCFIIA